MTREIKFRAWEKSYKRMSKVTEIKWKEEHLYHQIFTQAIVNNKRIDDSYTYDFSGVSNGIVLMQYTGLKDKNAVEIYEGDIIQCTCGRCSSFKYVVRFQDGAFCLNDTKFPISSLSLQDLLIVGNIYENEEMINR